MFVATRELKNGVIMSIFKKLLFFFAFQSIVTPLLIAAGLPADYPAAGRPRSHSFIKHDGEHDTAPHEERRASDETVREPSISFDESDRPGTPFDTPLAFGDSAAVASFDETDFGALGSMLDSNSSFSVAPEREEAAKSPSEEPQHHYNDGGMLASFPPPHHFEILLNSDHSLSEEALIEALSKELLKIAHSGATDLSEVPNYFPFLEKSGILKDRFPLLAQRTLPALHAGDITASHRNGALDLVGAQQAQFVARIACLVIYLSDVFLQKSLKAMSAEELAEIPLNLTCARATEYCARSLTLKLMYAYKSHPQLHEKNSLAHEKFRDIIYALQLIYHRPYDPTALGQ